jgi:hypothetical protein
MRDGLGGGTRVEADGNVGGSNGRVGGNKTRRFASDVGGSTGKLVPSSVVASSRRRADLRKKDRQ